MRSGWLLEQLPRTMQGSEMVRGFTAAGEDIADSVRDRMDTLADELDPASASPEMLTYLASWLGFALDPHDPVDVMRRIVASLGNVVRYRGTAFALAELAEVMTGDEVQVFDPGWVIGPGDTVPGASNVVQLVVARAGPLGRERLQVVLERDLPVGVRLEIRVTEEGDGS